MDFARLKSYRVTKQLQPMSSGAKGKAEHKLSPEKLCLGAERNDAAKTVRGCVHTAATLIEPGTSTAELTAFKSIKTHFSFEAQIYPCDNFCGETCDQIYQISNILRQDMDSRAKQKPNLL